MLCNLKKINSNAVSDWRYAIKVHSKRTFNGVKYLMKSEDSHQIFKLQCHLLEKAL